MTKVECNATQAYNLNIEQPDNRRGTIGNVVCIRLTPKEDKKPCRKPRRRSFESDSTNVFGDSDCDYSDGVIYPNPEA